MIALFLAAALAQAAGPAEKEIDEAIRKCRETFATASAEDKILALKEVVRTKHERVVRAVGEIILADQSDAIRAAAALAVGEIDHPVTSEVLVGAIAPSIKRPEVLKAILRSIGELGWQDKAVEKLNKYLRDTGNADLGPVMPDIVATIGQLRSLDSMDPLIELLTQFQTVGRRLTWLNEAAIAREIENALRTMVSMEFTKAADWQQWWRAYREPLKAAVERTYWVKKTGARKIYLPGDRLPSLAEETFICAKLPPGKPNVSPTPPGKRKGK